MLNTSVESRDMEIDCGGLDNMSIENAAYEKLYNACKANAETEAQFHFVLYQLVVPVLFGTVTLVGAAGNSLVIWVIISRAKMRTVTNIMLLNLAVADLCFVFICPPFTAYQMAMNSWPFGDVVCKMMHYLLNVTAYVTVYTLVLISVFRYLTILYSQQTVHLRTKRNVAFMIVFCWLLFLGCNVPVIFTHGKVVHNETLVPTCENYGPQVGKGLFSTFFAFAYVLPLCIIAILSILILHHINKQKPTMLGKPKRRSDDKKKQASRLIILVVVIFAIFWLPIHIHLLVAYFGTIPDSYFYQAISITFNVLAYSNSCVNPIIYNFASQDFRSAFHSIVCCCCDRNASLDSNSNGTTDKTYMDNANGGEMKRLVSTVKTDRQPETAEV